MKGLRVRFDRWQRERTAIGLPLAAFKRFGEHGGSNLAATVAYYCFFSVFPLLLVFVTVLGLVLEDDPDLRDDLVDGALGQIPVIGSQLADSQDPLTGSTLVLVLGVATAVWAGLAAVAALQHALDEVWDVPQHTRSNALVKRLRAVAFLIVFAIGIVLSTFLSSLTAVVDVGLLTPVLGFLGSVVVNIGVLLAMFLVLPSVRRPVRSLLVGAVPGGIGLAVLLQFGRLVFRALEGSSDTYGTFAVVIGLLGWFHLVSRVVLVSAMLHDVVSNRLWPRSLSRDGELTAADRKAALLDMHRIQRDPRFGFALSVDDGVVGTDATPAPIDPARAAAEHDVPSEGQAVSRSR